MTRSFIPTPKHAMICKLLLAAKPIREIARELKQNPGTVIRRVRTLEKNGYIFRQIRSTSSIYGLTLDGYRLLELVKNERGNTTEKVLTGSVKGATVTEKSRKMYRLHALQVKYMLVEPLKAEKIHLIQFKDHPTSRMRVLNNHSDLIVSFENFTATLSTKALKITGLEVRMPFNEVSDPEDLLEEARKIFEPEIQNIEMLLRKHFPGLRLRRLANNVLDGKIIKGEIAIEGDELAVKVGEIQKNSDLKFRVFDHEDGKLAEIVDFSKGPPEFETVHPDKYAENMRSYVSFVDWLESGQLNQAIDTITKKQEELSNTMHRMTEITQGIITTQAKQQELNSQTFNQFDERTNELVNKVEGLAIQFYESLQQLTRAITGR